MSLSVAEIASTPISAPPPRQQKAITLMGSFLILPFRIVPSGRRPVPSAADPLLPSLGVHPGITHEVL